MKCFALTGGIASGKSAVSAMLQKSGIPVINADVLARQVVAPGSIGSKLIEENFGKEFIDESGTLNRKKMAELIFADSSARQKLENITHPLIAEQLHLTLKKYAEQKTPYVVYEAPLIFEKKLESLFDATILVIVHSQIQKQRLMNRDGISLKEARSRIKTQMSAAEKKKKTRFVIDNSDTLSKTREQLKHIWFELTKESLKH